MGSDSARSHRHLRRAGRTTSTTRRADRKTGAAATSRDIFAARISERLHALTRFCYDALSLLSSSLEAHACLISIHPKSPLSVGGPVPRNSRRICRTFHRSGRRTSSRSAKVCPPGYRMRADSHYVDQLTSRRAGATWRPAGTRTVSGHAKTDASRKPRSPPASDCSRRWARRLRPLPRAAAPVDVRRVVVDPAPECRSASARRPGGPSWLLRAHALLDGATRGQSRPRPLGLAARADSPGPDTRVPAGRRRACRFRPPTGTPPSRRRIRRSPPASPAR